MEKKNVSAKILVAFYSMTGNTRLISEAIAGSLDADVEEIREKESRAGILGFLRSGYEAIFKKLPHIEPIGKNPGDYDLTIIGSPVWAGRLSSPVRSYMSSYCSKVRKVAFFTTCGIGSDKIFKQMEEISSSPIATLEVKEEEIASGNYMRKIEEFTGKLKLGSQT
ncbi:MAG: flavodoxin [Candidatus Bathyarchaeia archaeon]